MQDYGCHRNISVLPIVVGALGCVTKGAEQYLEKIGIKVRTELIWTVLSPLNSSDSFPAVSTSLFNLLSGDDGIYLSSSNTFLFSYGTTQLEYYFFLSIAETVDCVTPLTRIGLEYRLSIFLLDGNLMHTSLPSLNPFLFNCSFIIIARFNFLLCFFNRFPDIRPF